MDWQEARSRDILACLGDASRFRLVLSLLERERCVTELAGEVGLSQSCTTRHLQYLEREGLVRGVRQGKRVVFQLRSDRARVRDLLAWVTAASHDRVPQQVSGAEVHTEGPARPGRTGRRASRSRPRRALQPPLSDPPWDHGAAESVALTPAAGDGRGAGAGPEAAEGMRVPAIHADPSGGPVPSPGDARTPIKSAEMEDWLL
jgi:DNA-binding transcriptional ArsR family regulator